MRTGIAQGDEVEVASPAIEGRVVTLGQHLLLDGASVSLPGAPAGRGDGKGGGRREGGR